MVRPSVNFWHQLIAFEKKVRNVSRGSVRFVQVPGSDQMLPDVYMVTLAEEDEEGQSDDEQDSIHDKRASYKREHSGSPTESSDNGRDSGVEYEDSVATNEPASQILDVISDLPEPDFASKPRFKHLSGADSGDESGTSIVGDLA